MTTRTEFYGKTATEFLVRAHAYLAADDLLQASKKGWGAAARAVKAAAESRGWNHSGHRQLHQAVDRLVRETGDIELRNLFSTANTLHSNFYDGFLSAQAIGETLEGVERFVALLRPLTL